MSPRCPIQPAMCLGRLPAPTCTGRRLCPVVLGLPIARGHGSGLDGLPWNGRARRDRARCCRSERGRRARRGDGRRGRGRSSRSVAASHCVAESLLKQQASPRATRPPSPAHGKGDAARHVRASQHPSIRWQRLWGSRSPMEAESFSRVKRRACRLYRSN